ncbi:MAG: hypothetical protein KDK70_26165, partial [Myxococcales bacterium]|nr:hypothetical protein [Myxococcales bacterium]
AHNASDTEVTLVRPMYGSWERARQPEYQLEWTDAEGTPILDPLGFAPGLDCGTLDRVEADDLVRLPAGATAELQGAPDARPGHEVLPSARPGRYQLRVVYVADEVGGATPLRLRSEPVAVEITGGDAATWECRAEQVAARDDHEYAEVGPARLLPAGDGTWWLVYGRYVHRVHAGERDPGGDVWIRRLDATLAPLGGAEPVRLLRSDDEVGWVSVAAVGDGLVVITTPGPVGSRRVEAFAVALADGVPRAGEVHRLQAAPGNPYVTGVRVVGDEVLVLHEGGEGQDGTLWVSRVGADAAPRGEPRRLAEDVTDFAVVDGAEPAVVWLQRGEHVGGAAQRLTADGAPSGAPLRFALEPGHSLLAARLTDGALQVGYADRSTRGDVLDDRMGIYVQRYGADGAPAGAPVVAGPEAKHLDAFGALAWHQGALVRAFYEVGALRAGVGTRAPVTLSRTASSEPSVESHGDRWVVLWDDARDDDSPACWRVQECVTEIHGAVLGARGSVVAGPARLTRESKARPFVPSSFEWTRYCEG